MARPTDSFDELLMRLEPGCSSTQEAYARCRLRLVKFFQWRNCEDSEGLADDTITRFFESYAAGTEIHADNPYSFLYGIALNVFREFLRQKTTIEKIKRNWRPPIHVTDQYLDCKKLCFDRLSSDKRDLLRRYYGSSETPEKTAEALRITVGALRLRICRIKAELRLCYRACRGG
jgi:DNA-directed RNA polymerase specialized sigma24 family protein